MRAFPIFLLLWVSTLLADPFDDWTLAQFGSAIVSDPTQEESVWGEQANPDGDLLTNLEEAYYGTNPQVKDAPRAPLSGSSNGVFVHLWQRALDPLNLEITPRWSPDLIRWYESGDGPPGSAKDIVVNNRGALIPGEGDIMAAGVFLEGTERLFLNLTVTRPAVAPPQPADIDSLIVRTAIVPDPVFGGNKTVFRPYLLLNPDVILSQPVIDPLNFSLSDFLQERPNQVGTWSRNGAVLNVDFGSPQQWETWFSTTPAQEGTRLNRVVKSEQLIRNGNRINQHNTLILEDNGRFTWRYFFKRQSENFFRPHPDEIILQGSYEIGPYWINFRFDDGDSERHLFVPENSGGLVVANKLLLNFELP